MKSKINVNCKNLFTKVRVQGNIELNLNVQGYENEAFHNYHKWQTSQIVDNNVKLKSDHNILRIDKKSGNNFYLVANGCASEFKELNFNSGFEVGDGFHKIEFFYNKIGNVSVEIGCVEYDKNLQRINLITTLKNELDYSPSKNARMFLPFVKVLGDGSVEFKGGKFKFLPHVIQSKKNIEQITDSNLQVVIPYSDFTNLKNSNDEAYKWKRRALSWENKAKHSKVTIPSENMQYDILQKVAKSLETSNGSRLYDKHNYTIAIITDEYMYNYYKDSFSSVLYLTPDNYSEELNTKKVDLVLYVSCWKGKESEEWRGIKYRDKPKKAFEDIVAIAKSKGIPLVFQTIEDPSNYEQFLPLAKEFDYVFTSDSNMIEEYKKDLNHENVFYGEYGVNPQFNNPIDSRKYIFDGAFFAGSYAKRYQGRCDDIEVIFDSIVDSGINLVVANRNYSSDDINLKFPEKYTQYMNPPIEHTLLQSTHKLFRYNINLNSIKNSPTMCAMRVYEQQAQGTYIISNYANSTLNNFPNIRILPTKQSLSLEACSNNRVDEYLNTTAALRKIMTDKVSFKVIGRLLDSIGLDDNSNNIGCIGVIYPNHVNLEFIEMQSLDQLVPILRSELGDWENTKQLKNIKYFMFYDETIEYGRFFVEDLLNGFAFTNSDYITKPEVNGLLEEAGHQYTTRMKNISTTIFSCLKFNPSELIEQSLHDKTLLIDNGYEIDPFGYSYKSNTVDIIKSSLNMALKFTIVVPVYNNGRFLELKCVPSLKRNKLWKNIEVILVDDGSTQNETYRIIDKLVSENENVSSFMFKDSGSGSASRPRNKGVELSTTNYIGFLDPDNEISPNGYDNLYDIIINSKEALDFVSGYHAKITSTTSYIGKHANQSLKIIHAKDNFFFYNGKFPVVPTQPALIKKSHLLNNEIEFVEGAAGQDTLYGWEVLFYSKTCAFTDKAHLIYYAEREGSITNVIDNSYFKKKLVMEIAQVAFLKKSGLLKTYKDEHLDNFINNWYKPKIELAEDKVSAQKELDKIEQLYK